MNLIEKLKELDSSATPGPWCADLGNWDIEQIEPRNEICCFDPMSRDIHPENKRVHSYCDMEFIVELRNALPKLLAVVEAAENMAFCIRPRYLDNWTPNHCGECSGCKVMKALAALDQP